MTKKQFNKWLHEEKEIEKEEQEEEKSWEKRRSLMIIIIWSIIIVTLIFLPINYVACGQVLANNSTQGLDELFCFFP